MGTKQSPAFGIYARDSAQAERASWQGHFNVKEGTTSRCRGTTSRCRAWTLQWTRPGSACGTEKKDFSYFRVIVVSTYFMTLKIP